MLGDSSVAAAPSGDIAATETRVVYEGVEVGFSSNLVEEDKNIMQGFDHDRMNYANRWPRQETLALLKIRSDMDAVFRDSSLKGPLWEEVSRKLAELGYHRSGKKCKEKFENVYKYHKRTKEGRIGKSEGKSYKFFDQLEALESHPLQYSIADPKSQTPMATAATFPWTNTPPIVSQVTVPSTTHPTGLMCQSLSIATATPTASHTINPSTPLFSHSMINPSQKNFPSSMQNLATHLFPSSTSSSTASEEQLEGSRSRKRKRKSNWKDFFKRLTRDVIKKQEELQNKFLETVDKCDHERMVREEAWRMQEVERINIEHETLIQERSTAAAKDAAVVAFLQKISGRYLNSMQTQETPTPTVPPSAQPRLPPTCSLASVANMDVTKRDNGESTPVSSSSRWPKAEVQALISLRANIDIKYQENGAKGPLWEDISAEMQKLGYNRSSKRCKEKWENINKYFKKVKDSNKKRPEDSKTCPYFDQLDSIYREKNKLESTANSGYSVKSISSTEPLMVHPEQQWPLQQPNQAEITIEDNGRDSNMDHNIEEHDDDINDDDDDGDSEEEDEGDRFEVVANRLNGTE